MSHQEIFALIEQLTAELGQRSRERLTPDAIISELGIDSLAMGQIVLDLERRLAVTIPDGDLMDVVTIGDLVGIVEQRLTEGPSQLDAKAARQ